MDSFLVLVSSFSFKLHSISLELRDQILECAPNLYPPRKDISQMLNGIITCLLKISIYAISCFKNDSISGICLWKLGSRSKDFHKLPYINMDGWFGLQTACFLCITLCTYLLLRVSYASRFYVSKTFAEIVKRKYKNSSNDSVVC